MREAGKPFQRFLARAKPLKRFQDRWLVVTPLKRGVNERLQETEMRPFAVTNLIGPGQNR